MPDISVIIVSWNVISMLDDCLASIETHRGNLDIEIVLVDSASTDDTVEMITQQYPKVILLPQNENIGFTRGNNIGLGAATGDYLLLLNPDTLVRPNMLQQMYTYLKDNPETGAVGPHTLNSDGTTQSSRRSFPTTPVLFLESTWLQSLLSQAALDTYFVNDQADNAVASVDWVQGHALMFSRQVYNVIGGLDEGYVMYFEELDWCKRAKEQGLGITYLGTAEVIHHGGGSSVQAGAYTYIQFNRSKIRYTRKFHGATVAFALRFWLLLLFMFQFLLESAKLLLRHKPELRRERVRTYSHVIRSGL